MSAGRLTAAAIDWNQRHIALWAARADERRALGGRHALNIARGLDMVVNGMRAALGAEQPAEAAAPSAPSVEAQIERLEARLAVCQPGLYPGTTIVTGTGPIMDALRDSLRARIAALRGEPLPAAPQPTAQPIILPPAEALPFTTGPQLDLFGAAA